ncbi:hypothetical protein D3C87_1195300 [compost metagenome]
MTSATTKSNHLITPSRFWKYHASISGIEIFMISDGWITMPTLSQRRAPLRIRPNIATAISSATPTVYKGTAIRISSWVGM